MTRCYASSTNTIFSHDSLKMEISLPQESPSNIVSQCQEVLSNQKTSSMDITLLNRNVRVNSPCCPTSKSSSTLFTKTTDTSPEIIQFIPDKGPFEREFKGGAFLVDQKLDSLQWDVHSSSLSRHVYGNRCIKESMWCISPGFGDREFMIIGGASHHYIRAKCSEVDSSDFYKIQGSEECSSHLW